MLPPLRIVGVGCQYGPMKAWTATAVLAVLLTACAPHHPLLDVYPELRNVPQDSWCEARGGTPTEVLKPDESGRLRVEVVGCSILPHTSSESERLSIRDWLAEHAKKRDELRKTP